ncbi:MAG: hypothetical protein GF308_17115 [Candidatus Heimdallarchaeota archaeon]|nr:hypothetical protein [Candidatus Heimdallarchaeota archaeon]
MNRRALFRYVILLVGFVVFSSVICSPVQSVPIQEKVTMSSNELVNDKSPKDYQITAYEVPPLPEGEIPDWELNLTGIGIAAPVTLNLSYLVHQINASQLNAYEEVVDYKGNNQTIVGIDILDLVQDYGGAWYAGEIEAIAEDGYSKSFAAKEIVYSLHPPAAEEGNIRILLAFAINGSYFPATDWADEGCLRIVAPSNQMYTYRYSYWVSNVTELSITDRWKCDFYVDGVLETSIEANTEETYTDVDYLEINLMYHDELTTFEGPSILSVLDFIGVSTDQISEIIAGAPDANNTLTVSELGGDKPAILALAMDEEYMGFNRGPFRLVGGNLNSWNWLKNCHQIIITTAEPTTSEPPTTSTPPTTTPETTTSSATTPGFLILTSVGTIAIITFVAVIIRRKRK